MGPRSSACLSHPPHPSPSYFLPSQSSSFSLYISLSAVLFSFPSSVFFYLNHIPPQLSPWLALLDRYVLHDSPGYLSDDTLANLPFIAYYLQSKLFPFRVLINYSWSTGRHRLGCRRAPLHRRRRSRCPQGPRGPNPNTPHWCLSHRYIVAKLSYPIPANRHP